MAKDCESGIGGSRVRHTSIEINSLDTRSAVIPQTAPQGWTDLAADPTNITAADRT